MTTAKKAPSKRDLLAILRELSYIQNSASITKALAPSQLATDKAEAALESWCKKSKTYQRLSQTQKNAYSTLCKLDNRLHRAHQAAVRRLCCQVRLDGPTDETITAVRRLAEKYCE